ncbi:MAG: hypothetical protein K6G85_04880, partial [Eubacterium sp.]|nr:hypothetical protein [Eubacterium sp.]
MKGAKEGFPTVLKVMPTLIGLMIAVGMLRASGFMDALGNFLGKWTGKLGFPGELMPLTIVKIFSSSAATGLLEDPANYLKYYVGYLEIINLQKTMQKTLGKDFSLKE